MSRSRASTPTDASSAESSSLHDSSTSSAAEDTSSPPKKEKGIDIIQAAKVNGTICGHFYSSKTGDPECVRQIYPSLRALALALYLEYCPLVQLYQRGDASQTCARREGVATPLGTPYPISYVWENTVQIYLPDYVGKLIDGRLFIAEAGVAALQRTPEKRAATDAARQFAKAQNGVFWIATEEQLGSLGSVWYQNMTRLHGRRSAFPAYAKIRNAVLALWPWGTMFSIPEVVKKLGPDFSDIEVEVALWKMIGDAAASGHLDLNLAEVPLKLTTEYVLLDPTLKPRLPTALPDALNAQTDDATARSTPVSSALGAASSAPADVEIIDETGLIRVSVPKLPGKSIDTTGMPDAVSERFERNRKAVYEVLSGAPIRATAEKYDMSRSELGRLTKRARELGEKALLPHGMHRGQPLLRSELRVLIRKLHTSPQQPSPKAISEHPAIAKLAVKLSKQEGFDVPKPSPRQVQLEIERYEEERHDPDKHPSPPARQTELHPPRDHLSTDSFVLSIAGPAQVCQVDEYYWDGLIVCRDNTEITMRVYAAVLVCVRTGAILSYVLSAEPLVVEDYMLLVKRAMEPKELFLQRYGYKTMFSWRCTAKPSIILHDNGPIFISKEAIRVLVDRLQIIEEAAPPFAPKVKGTVEEIFDWVNTKYIHRFPGTTKSNPKDRGAYDSEAEAIKAGITFDNLEEYFTQAIVDDYMRDWDKTRRKRRYQMWEESVHEYGVVPYLGKEDDLKLLLMRSYNRKNPREGRYMVHDYKGVSFHDYWYTNPEVTPFLRGDEVTIYFDRGDVTVIYAFRDNQYVGPLMCGALLALGKRVSWWELLAMQKHDRIEMREAGAETQQTRTAIHARASSGKRAQARRARELERARLAARRQAEFHPEAVLAQRDAIIESLRLQAAERQAGQPGTVGALGSFIATTPISVQAHLPPPVPDDDTTPPPKPLKTRPFPIQ